MPAGELRASPSQAAGAREAAQLRQSRLQAAQPGSPAPRHTEAPRPCRCRDFTPRQPLAAAAPPSPNPPSLSAPYPRTEVVNVQAGTISARLPTKSLCRRPQKRGETMLAAALLLPGLRYDRQPFLSPWRPRYLKETRGPISIPRRCAARAGVFSAERRPPAHRSRKCQTAPPPQAASASRQSWRCASRRGPCEVTACVKGSAASHAVSCA